MMPASQRRRTRMSFEEKIEKLTAALIENTAALRAAGGSAPKTETKADAKAGAKATGTKAKVPTKDEVTAAAKAYATEHGKPAAKALIAKHGGADLASLPEANYAAFIAATKEAPEADEPEDDDGL